GRPTVRVKGSTLSRAKRCTTFYSSPTLRTMGGTKGLVPFKGRKVSYVRTDPPVFAGRIVAAGCAQSRVASQAGEAQPRRAAPNQFRCAALRRSVRARQTVRVR